MNTPFKMPRAKKKGGNFFICEFTSKFPSNTIPKKEIIFVNCPRLIISAGNKKGGKKGQVYREERKGEEKETISCCRKCYCIHHTAGHDHSSVCYVFCYPHHRCCRLQWHYRVGMGRLACLPDTY